MSTDLKSLLEQEFTTRKIKNTRYSLRSFARNLKIDPTSLLRIMNGERVPSPETARKILENIGMDPVEIDQIIEASDGLKPIRKNNRLLQNAFDHETFEKVFASQHVLVLAALRLEDLTPEELQEKICKKLVLTQEHYAEIVEDLVSVGALAKAGEKIKVVFKNKSTVPLPLTSQKRRAIQQEFLQMASQAIDDVPFDARENATLTLSVNRSDLDKVKEILKEARTKINTLCESNNKRDAIYNVCTALYPVIQ